jgi:hypothetical protein
MHNLETEQFLTMSIAVGSMLIMLLMGCILLGALAAGAVSNSMPGSVLLLEIIGTVIVAAPIAGVVFAKEQD